MKGAENAWRSRTETTNFETHSKAMRWSKTGKVWHVRKKKWVEEQNGDHERRTSEEDVGDLLLGVDEVLGNPAIPKKKNGKGNEDEVQRIGQETNLLRHQALTFHLARKPISLALELQQFSMSIKGMRQ